MKCFFAFVLIFPVLLCSCNEDANTENANPKQSISESKTYSKEYDECLDTSVTTDFAKYRERYPFFDYEEFEKGAEAINRIKNMTPENDKDAEYIKKCQKNYGRLETAEQVKLAAIDVFYGHFQDSSVSMDDVKVFREKERKLWIAEKICDWMFSEFGHGITYTVVFTDDGNIYCIIYEQ